MSLLSWTQPICDRCWDRQNPGREAYRLEQRDYEVCAWCNAVTESGIYVREDPHAVPFPARSAS